jgi:hypothetical protein
LSRENAPTVNSRLTHLNQRHVCDVLRLTGYLPAIGRPPKRSGLSAIESKEPATSASRELMLNVEG